MLQKARQRASKEGPQNKKNATENKPKKVSFFFPKRRIPIPSPNRNSGRFAIYMLQF